MTGTFPEALKQGRTAMPYQSHKRARKSEKLSAHKLWPQRRTVNPQKQCAADEKAQRGVIALADRCKGCVPNSLLTAKDFAVVDAMYACGAHSSRREHIR